MRGALLELFYSFRLTRRIALFLQRRTRRQGGREKYILKKPQDDDLFWQTAESRPLVRERSQEAGEDYWIDEKDLEKAKLREQAIKNRKVSYM
jgi:hypothetical protein